MSLGSLVKTVWFRTGVATAAFAGVILGAVFLVTGMPEDSSHTTDPPGAKGESPRPEEPFFYKVIGRSPEGFPKNAGSARNREARRYTLEIRVVDDRGHAEKLVKKLRKRGVRAYYTPLSRKGRVVYRIRRGMYDTRDVAQKAARQLREKHAVDAGVAKLR